MFKYQIQWDNRSRRFAWRVLTASGLCLAYFVDRLDAIAYCEGVLA